MPPATTTGLKAFYSRLKPYWVAVVALYAPLKVLYRLLTEMHLPHVPWYAMVFNVFDVTAIIASFALCSVAFAYALVYLATLPLWIIVFLMKIKSQQESAQRLDHTRRRIVDSLIACLASIFFVLSCLYSDLRSSGVIDVFAKQPPPVSRWSIWDWATMAMGAGITITCYVYLYKFIKRWLKAHFASDNTEPVKDLLR